MREHSTRIESRLVIALAALAMAACLALLALPATAQAYEGDALTAGSVDVSTQADQVRLDAETLWAGGNSWSVSIAFLPQNAKIIKVISSKPKVIKASLYDHEYYGKWPMLQPLKAGKSKITVKYKVGSKTKKVSATFKVKKYPNPYASILVNGKKIDIKKNKFNYFVDGYKKASAKVKVKPAKGWTILGSTLWVGDKNKDYKDGKSFKTPKGKYSSVNYVLQNAKGEVIYYNIVFAR